MLTDDRFRSKVVMSRHGFGRGEYKYFAYPLPGIIAALRPSLYAGLAPIADGWNAAMRIDVRYPGAHEDFIRRCHKAGQTRPTPLLLQYGEGDYNCLHQDIYGEHVFPLQVVMLLSEPGEDFSGGEFVLTEQRPRMQSRAEVVPLRHAHVGAVAPTTTVPPGFTFAASAANRPVPITSERARRLGIMSVSGTSRVATSVPSARGTRMYGACAPTTGSKRWQDV